MRALKARSLFIFLVSSPLISNCLAAQCTKDIDCKEDRICSEGKCVAPASSRGSRSEFICYFSGGSAGTLIPGLVKDDMSRRLQRVGETALIHSLPIVRTGPVETAAARIDETVVPPQREILYNPTYLDGLGKKFGELAVDFVLAHELGHHFNADVWMAEKSRRHQYEYAADAFAARVLARMNANEEQAIAAVQELPDANEEHPAPAERRVRILSEFRIVKAAMEREACIPPFSMRDGKCVQNCAEGQRWDQTRCVSICKAGQRWEDGECQSICRAGQRWEDGGCQSVCAEGERWQDGGCRSVCRDGEEWDPASSSCRLICESSERWNGRTCVSRCRGGAEWDEDIEECVEPVSKIPTAQLEAPVYLHNVMVPSARGNVMGMQILINGVVANAAGSSLQVSAVFSFFNGQPLRANPQEFNFRDANGFVATGTPHEIVPSELEHLTRLPITIPYYALNFMANGSTWHLSFVVYVFIDGRIAAQSNPVPFTFNW